MLLDAGLILVTLLLNDEGHIWNIGSSLLLEPGELGLREDVGNVGELLEVVQV